MPGMGKLDNALRWGFIKKVYGIMSTQLALTALVAAGSSYLFFNCPFPKADSTACELLTGAAALLSQTAQAVCVRSGLDQFLCAQLLCSTRQCSSL